MVDYAPGFHLARRPFLDFLNPAAPELGGASDAETIVRDGSMYTWVAGRSDSGIQLIRYGTDRESNLEGWGQIMGAVRDEDVGGLQRVTELETVTVGNRTFLLSLANPGGNFANSSVLNSFAIGADLTTASGGLILKDSVATDGSLREADDFMVAKVGQRAFALTWTISSDGQTDHGALGVHRLMGSGELVETTTLTEVANTAMPLKGIVDAEAAIHQGRTLVLTGANGAEGLGLWVLDSEGQLTLLDTAKTFQDQSAPSTSANLTAVHIATVGDRAFAFAYDTGGTRITTYEVVGDALVYRSDISLNANFNFQDMHEMKSFVWGGTLFVVASLNSNLALFVLGTDGMLGLAASSGNSSMTTVFDNDIWSAEIDFTVSTAFLNNVTGFDIFEVNGAVGISATSPTSEALNLLVVGAEANVDLMIFRTGTEDDDRFFGVFNSLGADGLGGNDQFFAGLTLDADGGTGNDSLYGGSANDHLLGGSGSDIILGGDGNDSLNGWASMTDAGPELDGGDSLEGGAGRDTITGGAGNDTIYGGSGADVIDGGTFDDRIDAGSGSDRITSGAGFDTLDGGEGTDDFVFNTNLKNNHDQIVGFELGFDQIKFKGTDLNTFAEVHAATTQVGADAVIQMRPGHTITLLGIDLDDLTAANFLFD